MQESSAALPASWSSPNLYIARHSKVKELARKGDPEALSILGWLVLFDEVASMTLGDSRFQGLPKAAQRLHGAHCLICIEPVRPPAEGILVMRTAAGHTQGWSLCGSCLHQYNDHTLLAKGCEHISPWKRYGGVS
jgi:hypothetical protein